MAMPMNTAVSSVNTYACTSTTMISSAEIADRERHRDRQADADAGDRRAEHLREQEHERQNRQNRDVAAGHVRRKSHRQRERPDEHAP